MKNYPHRSTEFYDAPVLDHQSIDEFLEANLSDGIHTVWGNRFPIDFHVTLDIGKPLLVYLNGAIPRSQFPTLPVFHGLRVMGGLSASHVSFSDPSCYADKDLDIGWFAGADQFPLQALMPRIIKKLITASKAPCVIFCGPSAGGFASIALALHFPKSLAFVWNPQTDITKYSPPMVAKYAEACFGLDYETALTKLPTLVDSNLAELYRKHYSGNTVLYLQNLSDGHVRSHAQPFLQSFCEDIKLSAKRNENRLIDKNIWYFSRNWGVGHVAPPGTIIRQILRIMIRDWRSWPTITNDGRMPKVLDQVFSSLDSKKDTST